MNITLNNRQPQASAGSHLGENPSTPLRPPSPDASRLIDQGKYGAALVVAQKAYAAKLGFPKGQGPGPLFEAFVEPSDQPQPEYNTFCAARLRYDCAVEDIRRTFYEGLLALKYNSGVGELMRASRTARSILPEIEGEFYHMQRRKKAIASLCDLVDTQGAYIAGSAEALASFEQKYDEVFSQR